MPTLKDIARVFSEQAISMRENDSVFILLKNGRSWEYNITSRDNGLFYYMEKRKVFHRFDEGMMAVNVGALPYSEFCASLSDEVSFLRTAWKEN